MPTPLEKEKPPLEDLVQHVEDVPEIPRHIEQGGVVASPTQVTAQVADDSGQGLMQTPTNQTFVITLPADDAQIETWSKGKIVDALTWFGLFWLRAIKKALHFGWKIVRPQSS
jgi:hypothetical protein